MCLFKVNTGCRDREVCRLRWDWEIQVPELNTSVFLIPSEFVKNREDRLVVLNRIAASVINSVRGIHGDYVFTYRGNPINNSAWQRAQQLNLPIPFLEKKARFKTYVWSSIASRGCTTGNTENFAGPPQW
jgi:integrase